MALLAVSQEAEDKRRIFFEAVFEGTTGFICIAAKKRGVDRMLEEFFQLPGDTEKMAAYIRRFAPTHDLYYCPHTFEGPSRSKDTAKDAGCAWSDLDGCPPEVVEEMPTFIIESSPNRFQALWKFDSPVPAYDAEDISRRLAYKYEAEGADKSGWDLTQLLRIPFTHNFKYGSTIGDSPIVMVKKVNGISYSLTDLQTLLPQVSGFEALSIPMPDESDLPNESGEDILQKYRKTIQPLAFHLFSETPERKKWSEALWQLEMFCLEAGMSLEEAFVVARDSACNKYQRDGRNIVMLWKELCRAQAKYDAAIQVLTVKDMEPLLSDVDRAAAMNTRTFVEEYIDWAKGIGDAAPQYHQAGAFILLSSLLAGPVRLPTSFGPVMPNLWFLIMADTTLTRKSTAMDLAMDILVEIDADAIMATDGSIEGLFSTLQYRPGRPSVFLRDEFSGLLESMTKKDYYAGMAETLTKLYDGKFQKRILRRDIIEVRDPVLILFAGGIRERILQLLQYEHVASGFLPRFVFIMAESDVTKLRPLGPPTDVTIEGRDDIIRKLTNMHNYFTSPQMMEINGKVVPVAPEWKASLTPGAWALYNHYESAMMKAALGTQHADLITPMFDRLSKSGLKAAVLLACTRMEEDVVVTEADLIKAFYYVEQWRTGVVDLLENIGRTSSERQVQNVLRAVQKEPGLHRSVLMQRWHLNAREAEAILMTLEQRGSIQRIKSGRTERLHPTVIPNQNI